MKKTVLILAVILLVLSTVSLAQMGGGMMGGYGYGMGWFGSMVMIVFWILVIVGLVFLIRWLASSTKNDGHGAKPEDSAIEILKKRYATGEITKEEFEEKKKGLL